MPKVTAPLLTKPVLPPPPPVVGLADKLRQLPKIELPPHAIVTARAGTGKTWTFLEGLNLMLGHKTLATPSQQQQAVWDEMMKSKGARYVTMVAYNRSIAKELKEKVPNPYKAMTCHGLGWRTLLKTFPQLKGDHTMNEDRVKDIIEYLMDSDIRVIQQSEPGLVACTERLVELCKAQLYDGHNVLQLAALVQEFEIDLEEESPLEKKVFELVPQVMDECRNVGSCIDYNDQVWLPVVLELPVFRSDLILVDEGQDLNRARQKLVMMAGKRVMVIGDDRQAIYGFTGADSNSLDRMYDQLDATPAKCVKLSLTETRRCGKAIVAEAKRIVPDFTAHPSNPEGVIKYAPIDPKGMMESYRTLVQNGDMVLCRANAPLVGQCLKMLRAGKYAYIQGKKDIAEGLISLINKLRYKDGNAGAPYPIKKFKDDVIVWRDEKVQVETDKKHPNENKIASLFDKAACLTSLADDCKTVEEVVDRLERIFTDNPNGQAIRLSSIHKAKGLEAKRVFILRPKGAELTPTGVKANDNLYYVGVTRAIDELTFVS